MVDSETAYDFARLFQGYFHAFGTGAGGWIHRTVTVADYARHLEGEATFGGLGIGPLRDDGTCMFAVIDLDRPDFDKAKEMMALLPGVSWLERSRSGNAHVWVFFSDPIEAWVARGILREACAAVGERQVEVFPKTDRLLPGMVGNYVNLPYYGDTRPIIAWHDGEGIKYSIWDRRGEDSVPLTKFLHLALANRNNPDTWRKFAAWLGVPSPEEREQTRRATFGNSPNLHICAQYVIEHRDDNPVVEGHRAVVYFSLAKMLANWSEIDDDEALTLMALVNDASPDYIDAAELKRIYFNAKRGGFTSTGCDDPLFLPYKHPDCKIGER